MTNIQFPNQLFAGAVTAAVVDNNGSPSEVLEAGQPFTIDVTWTVSPLAALLLGGQWTVAAYVESIGAGPEQEIGAPVTVPVNGGVSYAATIKVPANTLPNNPQPPLSGVYKLVTVLTHKNFGTPTNVAGLVEGPLVRIG